MSVLIKAALLAVLLYLMMKAVANLTRAVLEDSEDSTRQRVQESPDTAAPSPMQHTRAFGEVDVEDARWEDL